MAEFWKFFGSIAKFMKKLNSNPIPVCQRILVSLAILMALHRNKVKLEQHRSFVNFCIALSPSGIAENDLKALHSELKLCKKYVCDFSTTD